MVYSNTEKTPPATKKVSEDYAGWEKAKMWTDSNREESKVHILHL